MENYVLGFFQEQLSKIIIGFRKEQVNANLLNGKGEIRDVQLNCSILNNMVTKLTPAVTFEEVHVSRLGFNVTSWANIRKAPILVDIGCITAVVEEPMQYMSAGKRAGVRMMTESEVKRLVEENLLKAFRWNTSYGIVDRIADNLTIEIQKLELSFRTVGKFKTKRVGPWTPPTLQILCKNIRIVAVDVHGYEGNSDQIWAHNHRRNQYFLLCKKIELQTSVRLINNDNPEQIATLIKEMKLEIQVAIKQRLKDGHILGIQSDITIPSVEIDIQQKDLPLLASLLVGIQYCLTKDRSFEDPLIPKSTASTSSSTTEDSKSYVRTVSKESNNEIVDENETSEDDKEDNGKHSEGDHIYVSSSSSGDEDESDNGHAPKFKHNVMKGALRSGALNHERPVLVLPLGFIIYESLCVTCSIHQASIRGSYQSEKEGYVQLTARGSIVEAIWPKAMNEFGFYGQTSVASCSMQEKYGSEMKILMNNGMKQEDHLSFDTPMEKPREVLADENFPLFERRSIRDDPLDLRHSFPFQGLGAKVTVDILNPDMSSPKVFHEVGIDKVEVILDVESWWRIARFVLNQSDGGYDRRLHSGDWSDILTVDMLPNPDCVLNMDDHLQPTPQIFLDDNFMISSDLFNATLRLTNVDVRIPAAVNENIRSCDVIMEAKETTVTITSALPRIFLSGKLGNSISGDNVKEKGVIDFPNDPSDIAYALEQEGDHVLRQQGIPTSKIVSTFRQQVTVRGFQIRIVPVIPFCNAIDPQQLIAPTDLTSIACFECETSSQESKGTKLVFFLSVQAHHLTMNIDFDLLVGMTSTLLQFSDPFVEAIKSMKNVSTKSSSHPMGPSRKVEKTLHGRKIMVKKRMSQSRESGGLSVVFCLKQTKLGLSLWRQNVPLKRPLRTNFGRDFKSLDGVGHMEAVKLLEISMADFEIGLEFKYESKESRRTVLKCCLEKFAIRVCDVNRAAKMLSPQQDESQTDDYMVDILSFGKSLPGNLSSSYSGQVQQFALRCEEQMEGTKAWSMAGDLTSPAIFNMYIDEIIDSLILFVEAMLMPTWSKRDNELPKGSPFPDKTVGAFFYSLIAGNLDVSGLHQMSYDFDISLGDGASDPVVERVMRKVFDLIIPSNVKLLLFRLEIANLLIQIPIDRQSKKHIGILLNQSDLCVRFYPSPGDETIEIEDVLACKGVSWSSLIKSKDSGFYQNFLSRSSLVSTTLQEDGTNVEVLVNPFGIELTYAAAKLDIAMNENISMGDIRLIEEYIQKIRIVGHRCKGHLSGLSSLFAAMKQTSTPKTLRKEDNDKKGDDTKSKSDPDVTTTHGLNDSRILIDRVQEELTLYELNIKAMVRIKDSNVSSLKRRLFLKEKERFGALALLSSRVAGWIRMGGVHQTSQRVGNKSTMWPYWAVLRKDILLLFNTPGDVIPQDAILLSGAKIRDLSGGSSIKRGFAIVESSGNTRYFVTTKSTDYMFWTREISSALAICNGIVDLVDVKVDNELLRETSEISHDPNLDQGFDNADSNIQGLGQRIKLGNKFSGARTRLSGAIQSAKQKGKEMSDSAIQKGKKMSDGARTYSSDLDTSGRHSIGSVDLSIHGEDSAPNGDFEPSQLPDNAQNIRQGATNQNDGRRGHFGTRIGSALQNARQRAIQTPEKQAGLGGLRGRISSLSPGNRDRSDSDGRLEESDLSDKAINNAERDRTYRADRQGDASLAVDSSVDKLAGSQHSGLYSVAESGENVGDVDSNNVGRFLRLGRRSPPPPNPDKSNNGNGRFNFRRRPIDVSGKPTFAGGPVILKGVHTSRSAPAFNVEDPIFEPLKVFEEHWAVSVSPKLISFPGLMNFESVNSNDCTPTMDDNNGSPRVDMDSISPTSYGGADSMRMTNDIFRIKVFQVDKVCDESSSEKIRSLDDIFEIHAQLSESIERIIPQLMSKKSGSASPVQEVSLDLIDKVIVSGTMLGGLLDIEERNIIEKTRNYQADVIETFLNSLLQCPLPVDSLAIMTEILGINAATKSVDKEIIFVGERAIEQAELIEKSMELKKKNYEEEKTGPGTRGYSADTNKMKVGNTLSDSGSHSRKILSLLSVCQAELLRAEREFGRIAIVEGTTPEEKCPKYVPIQESILPMLEEPLLTSFVLEQLNTAMHKTLMRVMTERDKSNAQLAANTVLYMHEVEHEKRKNKLLKFELEVVQQAASQNNLQVPSNVAQLFGGKFEVSNPLKEFEVKLKQLKLDNNEEMLVAMSRQLTDELREKKKYESEIERIKEFKRIGIDNDAAEKAALKEELKRLKGRLAEEENRSRNAIKEAEHWKQSYESLANREDNV